MPANGEPPSGLGPPPWSPAHLANALGGTLRNAPAPDEPTLERLAPLSSEDPGAIGFARTHQHRQQLRPGQLGALLVPADTPEHVLAELDALGTPLVLVPSPDHAINLALAAVHATQTHDAIEPGIHPSAHVDPSAKVSESASVAASAFIGPGAVIGDHARIDAKAYIGADTVVGPNTYVGPGAKLLARCELGPFCALHAGVVIGTDGFGYLPAPDGRGVMKVPHIGRVVIGAHVEIGANTCIDRGKLDDTVIGDGAKIDNLVQIGHNCVIGRAAVICGQAAIAGSCTIGDGAMIGGAAMIADNLTIGPGAKIGGGSGLMNHVPAGAVWFGVPAQPHREFFRSLSIFRRLPELAKALKPNASRQDWSTEAAP